MSLPTVCLWFRGLPFQSNRALVRGAVDNGGLAPSRLESRKLARAATPATLLRLATCTQTVLGALWHVYRHDHGQDSQRIGLVPISAALIRDCKAPPLDEGAAHAGRRARPSRRRSPAQTCAMVVPDGRDMKAQTTSTTPRRLSMLYGRMLAGALARRRCRGRLASHRP